jgi:hypothetical protein
VIASSFAQAATHLFNLLQTVPSIQCWPLQASKARAQKNHYTGNTMKIFAGFFILTFCTTTG